MNADIIKGSWKELRGKAKERWGKLTDSELDQVEGDATRLAGVIQKRYGISKEEAKKEIDRW